MGALETMQAFSEAVNAQQWDRVAGYLTEDFVFSGVTPQPVGKQGFIEGQQAWSTGVPDWHATPENLRAPAFRANPYIFSLSPYFSSSQLAG